MGAPWQISAGVPRVTLGKERTAEVVFTVTNPGPVDEQAIVDVLPGDDVRRDWFTVTEAQRTITQGGTASFPVKLAPGAEAPTGSYWFQGKVYSADEDPKESAVLSDRVAFEISDHDGNGGGIPWWVWVVAGVLVLAIAGVVLFLLLRTEPLEVPDVAGETRNRAVEMLISAGFETEEQQQPDADVAEGTVVRTNPAAGSELDEGSTVTVIVSSGPELVEIPRLRGEHFRDAVRTLEDLGFKTEGARSRHNTLDRDRVIRTSPAEGTEAEVGSTVRLLISNGPQITVVPRVLGLSVKNAFARIRERGLQPNLIERPLSVCSLFHPKGVVSQSPSANRKVRRGSTVTVQACP